MGLFLWTMSIVAARGQTLIDLRTQTKSVDFSGAGSTRPMQMGASLPAACTVGQFFFLTSAPAGSSVYACNPANIWKVQGTTLTVDSGTTNDVASSDGSSLRWMALGGDIFGPPGGVTVGGLRGRAVSNAAPSDGQVLKWNASAGQWQPAAGQTGNSSYVFAAQSSITIPESVHQFATANLIVECYDSSTPPQRVEADRTQINPATYDVTIGFSTPQTGYCVVNGAGTAGGSSGGGGISSVGGDLSGNTSAATVTGIQNRAVANSAPAGGQALVWNAAGSAWQPGALDAANIGSGTVNNTEFGYLSNVTSDIQAQMNSKAASTHTNSLSGDVNGNTGAATVTGIQNRPIASTAPFNGQALVWNSAAGNWQPSNVSGGSGSGAAMASQLGDLTVVLNSPTVLSIGANCGPSTPCNFRFGSQVFSINSGATATLSGSATGTAFIYVNAYGSLMVGHNLTVACAGCIQQSSVTSFPLNVIPIYSWTAFNGTWNSAGGSDKRAFLSSKGLAAGQGVVITEAPGQSTLTVDNGVIPTYLMNAAVLNYANISNGSCAADQNLTVTGANPGDAVAPGWPSALPPGVLGIMFVNSTNTVTVRLCNLSGSTVQPPSATYRATIVRNY